MRIIKNLLITILVLLFLIAYSISASALSATVTWHPADILQAENTQNLNIDATFSLVDKLISYSGWLFGILSIVIAIISNNSMKKQLIKYQYLFTIAGQNMDLTDKAQKLQALQNQLDEMTRQVADEIPKEASKRALKHLLDSEILRLEDNFEKVNQLKDQLIDIGVCISENDNALLEKVSRELQPAYANKRTQASILNTYLLITVIISLTNVIFGSLSRLLVPVMLLFQLTFIVRSILMHYKLTYTKAERTKIYRNILWNVSITCGVAAPSVVSAFIYFDQYYGILWDIVGIVVGGIYLLQYILQIYLTYKRQKKWTMFVAHSCTAVCIVLIILLLITSCEILLFITLGIISITPIFTYLHSRLDKKGKLNLKVHA